MAQISYDTFDEWGDLFIVSDYRDRFDPEPSNVARLAGLVLFDDDNIETLRKFIELAVDARTEAIMIELCHLTDYRFEQEVISAATHMLTGFGYSDLESYENRLAFGKYFE